MSLIERPDWVKRHAQVEMSIGGCYLALHKVTNASLSHDRDGDGLHDLLDHTRVGHASDATLSSDIGGDPLQGHHGGGPSFFGDAGLGQGQPSRKYIVWRKKIPAQR